MTASTIWQADASEEWVRDLIAVLHDWLLALEDGTVINRQPDPFYKWRGHEPTVQEIDKLLENLDYYIGGEWRNWGRNRGFDAPPEFERLAGPQRLALLQCLDAVLPISEQSSPLPPKEPEDEDYLVQRWF